MKQFRLIVLMSIAALGMSSVYGADVVPHQDKLLMVDLSMIPFDAKSFSQGFVAGVCMPGFGVAACVSHESVREYYKQKYNPLAYVQNRLESVTVFASAEDKVQCCNYYVDARRALTAGNIEASIQSIKEFHTIMAKTGSICDIVGWHNCDTKRSYQISALMGACVGSALSAGLLIALVVYKFDVGVETTAATMSPEKK